VLGAEECCDLPLYILKDSLTVGLRMEPRRGGGGQLQKPNAGGDSRGAEKRSIQFCMYSIF
jgi:hypothetical protein